MPSPWPAPAAAPPPPPAPSSSGACGPGSCSSARALNCSIRCLACSARPAMPACVCVHHHDQQARQHAYDGYAADRRKGRPGRAVLLGRAWLGFRAPEPREARPGSLKAIACPHRLPQRVRGNARAWAPEMAAPGPPKWQHLGPLHGGAWAPARALSLSPEWSASTCSDRHWSITSLGRSMRMKIRSNLRERPQRTAAAAWHPGRRRSGTGHEE